MDDEIQVLSSDPGLGQDGADAGHDTLFRCLWGGQDLAREHRAAEVEGYIGKGAADING